MSTLVLPPPIEVKDRDSLRAPVAVVTQELFVVRPREPRVSNDTDLAPLPRSAAALPIQAASEPAEPLFRREALDAYQLDLTHSPALAIVPLRTALLLSTLGAAVLMALGVAAFGQLELTTRARGVLRARSGVQMLSFNTDGVIEHVLVREGQRVSAGEPLLRLDSTRLRVSLTEADQNLSTVRARTEREDEEERLHLTREGALLDARDGILRRQLQNQASTVHHFEVQRRRDDGLADQGLIALQSARESEQLLSQARRSWLVLQDEVARVAQQQLALRQAYNRALHERKQRCDEASARSAAARALLAQTELRAARAGRVESLSAASGDVVAAGVAVARLVPIDRPPTIVAFVPERDRAFAAVGGQARVELDQMPVEEFGSARATVTRLATEAASRAELERALGAAAPDGVYFRADVELSAEHKSRRLTERVSSGALVTVRLTLRQRRILSLLFDPLRKWLS